MTRNGPSTLSRRQTPLECGPVQAVPAPRIDATAPRNAAGAGAACGPHEPAPSPSQPQPETAARCEFVQRPGLPTLCFRSPALSLPSQPQTRPSPAPSRRNTNQVCPAPQGRSGNAGTSAVVRRRVRERDREGGRDGARERERAKGSSPDGTRRADGACAESLRRGGGLGFSKSEVRGVIRARAGCESAGRRCRSLCWRLTCGAGGR